VRASRDLDGKSVFGFAGRGPEKRIIVNSRGPLSETEMAAADRAATICPTGSLVIKRIGYAKPIGSRSYDTHPIGWEIEG
jgi:[NiFe] hydrogenase diaphorase moiety small subunit